MKNSRFLRTSALLASLLLVLFLGLQFVRPRLVNPPVTAEIQAPPEVKQILRNSCYNCHSDETDLSWFDQVVPAYWLVASDVKTARKHLNFSEIGAMPAAQQKGVLFEAINQIQLGAMPLPSYTRVHPGAVVTAAQLAILRAYLAPASSSAPQPDPSTTAAAEKQADQQYDTWIHSGSQPTALASVQPAPNGIQFLPDYKNWRAISSTDRFDNHTMRVILGNDVAIQAIAENHINPWPNGTIFAKVAWFQQPGSQGLVRTGAFQQVEFMIRDSNKYASTKGWGWARWRGVGLKPYGTTPEFSNECVSCHTPVRSNDYVYTPPIRGQQSPDGGAQ